MILKTFLLIFILAVLSVTASAVPASPEPIILNHSDGNEIQAKLIGDERGYRIETANGSIISSISSKKEAPVKDNNQLPTAGRNLAPARIPVSKTTGLQKIIVILIDFQDTPPSNSNSYYQNLIFNSSTKSLNNYLKEVSYSKMSIYGNVTGWYTVSQNKAFYGGDVTEVDTNEDRIDPNTRYIESLAREAVLKADADVDFSKYDTDSDGIVDHIIIVQAGRDQASTGVQDDIWSHSSDIWTYNYVKKRFTKGVIVDGVIASNYIMVSGYDPMGVIAHEFGHDLGLIDLYDTNTGKRVVWSWDIMDSGAWNDHGNTPSHFSAWNKWQLGWLNLTNITYPRFQTAPGIETSPAAFRVDAGKTEYFIVENRQLSGYDSFLPKPGVLIWHIDEAMKNNSEPVKKVALVDASNGAASRLISAPFAVDYGYTAFTPFTFPDSSLNNGNASGVKIYDIGTSGNFMNLTFGFHKATIMAGNGTNYTRIQDAVNISQDGDSILVKAGNYSENILINKEITIKSVFGATVRFSPVDLNTPTVSIFSNNVGINGFSIMGINGTHMAIYAYNSSNLTITNNRILQNTYGIVLESMNNAKITDNEIYSNNRSGILSLSGINNTIIYNDIRNNHEGINLTSENSSYIYRNNIINNSKNVFDDGFNAWDGGQLAGGNYYSDYTGNDTNGDGKGESPYNISASLKDNYPFINPYGWRIKGDVNGDEQVTIVDALFVAQYTVGLRMLTSSQLVSADVNGDGQVTIVDALFIAQYTVGLRLL